ncbi:hypothetical protein QQX98_002557 [Neonectria punicea]|uniref:Fungal-specific transcription factor domain-containing protein n=1 Tax=Neonectria punicea TaxID=979145 RepID=A0ABR1HJ53_9HYPO
MEFRFIDNNTPLDRHSQRAIRSHAMKGKNLGKTIAARGHRWQKSERKAKSEGIPKVETQNGRWLLPKTDNGNTLLQNHFGGAELSYFMTPNLEPFTLSSRYLILHYAISQTLYPRVFCRQSKEAETSWFELMIGNPCGKRCTTSFIIILTLQVFHCGLAMTGAHVSRHLGQPDASLESTRHFAEAMRLLRRELSTNSDPQDSSLAVIISLAIHATLIGAVDESRIHLHGLKHVVQLRPGGLASLCAEAPEVGNKVRRADLNLALMAGTPTLFGAQSSPLPETAYVVRVDRRISNTPLPYPLGETSPVLQSAIRDVLALCSYAGFAQLGAFEYQDLVISIFQRLVDYAPLVGPRPSLPLDDVCQLGFLAFMNTVIHHNHQRTPACSPLLSDALRTRLDSFNEMDFSQVDECSSFCLWLTFVYAISAPGYDQYCHPSSPVARHIRTLADTLTLETWQDVTAHLSVYPWITAFHDEPGKKLWESLACA